MSPAKHLTLLVYSFVTWAIFVLIGWPEYYQQWWTWAKVTIVILVTLLYFPVSRFTMRKLWPEGPFRKASLWLALYLTLPLFVYDYLYLAVYKDIGIWFVVPYWYLTFFYFSFWLQIPYVGRRMDEEAALG